MEERHIHALDYLHIVHRRRWWLIVPVVASIIVGAVLVKVLPKEYRATATLAVAAPSVSPALVNQSAELGDQERLRALSQQLLGSPMLAKVIEAEHLGDARDEKAIARLRNAITVTVPEPVTVTERRPLDSFLVAYKDSTPTRARDVANRVVSVFIDENARTRAAHAEGTSAFLAAQLKDSEARLHDLEARLRQAKESHMGRLPEQTAANLATLSGLRQQLEANAVSLRGEQDRLSMIEREVQQLRSSDGAAVVTTNGGGVQTMQTPEARVADLQRQLNSARMVYTDQHPEVQQLQEELASARQAAAAARQRLEAGGPDALRSDPALRQLATDRDMARLRVRDLQRADTELRREIAAYQARVESAPMVEQQLASMQRDYDLEKQQYSDLSSKLHSAGIAENVERNGNGEQFTLQYPATLPTAPSSPIAWRVMALALAFGIALGCAAAVLREYVDRTVHDIQDLRDELDYPILGQIPHINAA